MNIKKIFLITMFVVFIISIYSNIYAEETITFLNAPTNLNWKTDSTATVSWNGVENANYYIINIYLYGENNQIIGTKETGTSYTELDIQQEIQSILSINALDLFYVSFNVEAEYISDETVIKSDVSDMSDLKCFNYIGKIELAKPTNVTLSNDYYASWSTTDSLSNICFFAIDYKIEDKNHRIYTGNAGTSLSKSGTRISVKELLKNAYDKAGYSGETVKIAIRVCSYADNNTDYKTGYYSEYSNYIDYSNTAKIVLAKPTNVTLSDDYYASWSTTDSLSNIWFFAIDYKIEDKNHRIYTGNAGTSLSKSGTRISVKELLKNAYDKAGYSGETVKIAIRVCSYADNNTDYKNSLYSEYSNYIDYSNTAKIILAKPTNVTLSDDYYASWSTTDSLSNIWFFAIDYKIEDKNHRIYTGSAGTSLSKSGTRISVKELLKNTYDKIGYSGETVKIAIRVCSYAGNNTDYKTGYYSEYSNYIYYNPNGSTIINKVTLSPSSPVIGVGRSMYIGKTIEPETAYYSVIDWSVSDSSIVSINNMGMITGLKKGKTNVTAIINNAIETAQISVYEIKTNINDSKQSNDVLNEAYKAIESIIENKENENIEIINREETKNDIINGVRDNDIFNVDIKSSNKSEKSYSLLENEIKSKFKGYDIVGGSDVKVEVSHTNNIGKKQHIVDLTELENEIDISFNLSEYIPKQSIKQSREYKLIRLHEDNIEQINFKINNGIVETSSDKFSDFILLYKDTDLPQLTDISLSKTNLTLNEGDYTNLIISYTPNETSSDKTTIWESSDNDVVKVDGNGKITALKTGNAIITVKVANLVATCNVIVKSKDILLENISLSVKYLVMYEGEIEKISVNYIPNNITSKPNIIWDSSNTNVAIVDNNGKITAKSKGNTIITASVGNNIKSSCSVSVLTNNNYLLGDVNSDNKIDINDAILILKHITGKEKFTDTQIEVADVTKDGKTDIQDAIQILKFIVGKIKCF